MVRKFYELAKPGIIYGNLLTAGAGFIFAAKAIPQQMWGMDLFAPAVRGFAHLAATLIGLGMVIACSCVINNLTDRRIDALMERTKGRALVVGSVSARSAVVYALALGTVGFAVLIVGGGSVAACTAAVGVVFYTVFYAWGKRAGYWGTLVGSVAGAVPIVVGYAAETGAVDRVAMILFLTMVLWQMPHFYSIALRRIADYRSAHIPVLPIAKGERFTRLSIVLYICAFIAASESLALAQYASPAYAIGMATAGFWWLWIALKPFLNGHADDEWARKTFKASLIVLVIFSALLVL